MPKVGEAAPDFELKNQDDKTVRLSDFHGKTVVMFAYPKADTPGCTTQACGFRDHFPQLEAKGVVVLGISPDVPKDLAAWKAKQKLPYDLLSDPEHKTLESWGVWGEKSMYGKKYMGVTRSHWVIDEHGVVIEESLGISPKDSVANAVKRVGG
jgi:thioredoxin-dependent peroxiredoxin